MPKAAPANREAARELEVFISNDEASYDRAFMAAVRNLNAKVRRGTYNREKALKAMEIVAEFGAKRYGAEYMNRGEWSRAFSVATRRSVARKLLQHYEDDYRV